MRKGEKSCCDTREFYDLQNKFNDLLDAVRATILIDHDGSLPIVLYDAYHKAGGDLMMQKEQAE